jgi:hypothetical protein
MRWLSCRIRKFVQNPCTGDWSVRDSEGRMASRSASLLTSRQDHAPAFLVRLDVWVFGQEVRRTGNAQVPSAERGRGLPPVSGGERATQGNS